MNFQIKLDSGCLWDVFGMCFCPQVNSQIQARIPNYLECVTNVFGMSFRSIEPHLEDKKNLPENYRYVSDLSLNWRIEN